MRVVGVDPGLSGAIAVIDQDEVVVHDLPTLQVGAGTRREYDVPALVRLIREVAGDVWFVERQQPVPENASASYKIGLGQGIILGILAALGIPHQVVAPQVWQRELYAGAAGAGKDRSMLVAGRLFPQIRIPRHDWADALLVAEYGRRSVACDMRP